VFGFFKRRWHGNEPEKVEDLGSVPEPSPSGQATGAPEAFPVAGPSPRDFPISELTPQLSDAAEAIHNATQAPLGLCAQSVIGAASLVVSNLARVQTLAPGDGADCTLFLAAIAESGERKSAADKLAMRGINKILEKRMRTFGSEMSAYKEAKASLKPDEPAPIKPQSPQIIFGEPTYQGMLKVVADGPGFAGLFTDEGAKLFGGIAMSPENKATTSAGLSELWDGSAVSRPRSGDSSPSFIPPTRLSMNVMLQPTFLPETFGDDMLVGQGMMARVLAQWPRSLMGTRRFQRPCMEDLNTIKAFQVNTAARLEQNLDQARDSLITRRLLEATDPAFDRLVDFYEEVEAKLAPGGVLRDVSGFASKAPEHAARLAGVMTLFENPNALNIDLDAMSRAISLIEFHMAEFQHLRAAALQDTTAKNAKDLLDWLLTKGKPGQSFATESVQQFGPSHLRKKADLDRALSVLVQFNWLTPLPAGTVVNQKPRKRAYRLHPKAKMF